ncbi:GTP 3',8-cyclase MoaA [Gallibacterium trehalosifermentans]|uniref:GTP 3',8-cyclase n=1 Tax=Gallibacterium trehalosifermentans TaxID=516935 RepID=A0ABV6H131_9PAST
MQSYSQVISSEDRLIDNFNRQYFYLRLSITDVCNFKCNYCLPDGYQPPSHKQRFLSVMEIERLVRAFAQLGTEKVRITGGEPTLRKDFLAIVEAIRKQPRIKKIALTTNGYRMAKDVADWRAAGVDSINVSIDSLDPRLFQLITGENKLIEILQGIERAFAVGYDKVKVNAVLMKNLNAQGFETFLHWIKDQPIQMRFIELMQTGDMDHFFAKHHLSGAILKQKLLASGWQLQAKHHTDGPAQVFKHHEYVGEIGLIMPYEKDFCASCNRLRVSALGKLHLCLFGEAGIDIRQWLQDDNQQFELQQQLIEALQGKREHHFLHQGDSGVRNHLASIGG